MSPAASSPLRRSSLRALSPYRHVAWDGRRVGAWAGELSGWVHIADFLSAVETMLSDDRLEGVVHVTGPDPVRNAELMAGLPEVLHRSAAPPTPAPLVRLGGILLRTDPALALTGWRCVPARLLEHGFAFAHPDLVPALADLLGPG